LSGLFFCVDGALLALGMIAYQTAFLAQPLPEEVGFGYSTHQRKMHSDPDF